MSSDKRYDALRRAAGAKFISTRWTYAGCNTVETDDQDGCHVAHPDCLDGSAEFIAAADPNTIRQLIADYDALTARVEAAERDARRLETQKAAMLLAMRRSILALAFAAETSPAMRDDYNALSAAIDAASGQSTGETE